MTCAGDETLEINCTITSTDSLFDEIRNKYGKLQNYDSDEFEFEYYDTNDHNQLKSVTIPLEQLSQDWRTFVQTFHVFQTA